MNAVTPSFAPLRTEVIGSAQLGGRGQQPIADERAGAEAAQVAGATEQQPLVVRKRAVGRRVLHASGEHGLADHAQIAARIRGVLVDGLVEAAHVQTVSSRRRAYTALRGKAGSPRVSSATDRPRPSTADRRGCRSRRCSATCRRRRGRRRAKLRSARAVHSTRCSSISKCGFSRCQMPNVDSTRVSGPV